MEKAFVYLFIFLCLVNNVLTIYKLHLLPINPTRFEELKIIQFLLQIINNMNIFHA